MQFGSYSNDQVDSSAHAGIQPLGKIRVTCTSAVLRLSYSRCGRYLPCASAFSIAFFCKQLELSHCCQTVWGPSHTHKSWKYQSVGDTSCDLSSNLRLYPTDYCYDKPCRIIDATQRISQLFWSSPLQNAFSNYCENHKVHMLLLSICISVSLKICAFMEVCVWYCLDVIKMKLLHSSYFKTSIFLEI